MTLISTIVLAIIQGLTEFLPISSSGHMALVEQLWLKGSYSVAFEVATNLGTLVALIIYFRKDIADLFIGIRDLLARNNQTHNARLVLLIAIATPPVLIVGLFYVLFDLNSRHVELIGWTSIIFGLLLGLVDHYGSRKKTIEDMSYKNAFFIGLMQAISLIPGVSRSGITMTAARFLGFTRMESARFSMLLVIPVVLSSTLLLARKLLHAGNSNFGLMALLGFVISALVALASISFMMRWLNKSSFTPFVIYRVILGLILLFIVYQTPIMNFIHSLAS